MKRHNTACSGRRERIEMKLGDLFFENIINLLPVISGVLVGAILEHLGLLAWLWG